MALQPNISILPSLKGGEIVVDIGAYAGVTSIIFAQLVGPTGHVYAFEADETNYECARINIEMAEKVFYGSARILR